MTAQPSPLVLLVEDEFLIQDLLQGTLEDAGYAVEMVDNGTAAIEVLTARFGEFCAVVTDVNLGGSPNGWEVARKARDLAPHLPIVYVTGDSVHDYSAQGLPYSLIIQKPFVGGEIVVALATLKIQAASAPPSK